MTRILKDTKLTKQELANTAATSYLRVARYYSKTYKKFILSVRFGESEFNALGQPSRVSVYARGSEFFIKPSTDKFDSVITFKKSSDGYITDYGIIVSLQSANDIIPGTSPFGTEEIETYFIDKVGGEPVLVSELPKMNNPVRHMTKRKKRRVTKEPVGRVGQLSQARETPKQPTPKTVDSTESETKITLKHLVQMLNKKIDESDYLAEITKDGKIRLVKVIE